MAEMELTLAGSAGLDEDVEGTLRCALCSNTWPEQLFCPRPAAIRTWSEASAAELPTCSKPGGQERQQEPSQPPLPCALPSLCLPCDQLVRRRQAPKEPLRGHAVLLRGAAAALQAAAAGLAGEEEFQPVLSQTLVDLGKGSIALLLNLSSHATVARVLKEGVPGCAADYLPGEEAQASSFTVAVYPAVLDLDPSSPIPCTDNLGNWLSSVGCTVLSGRGHYVELSDAESRLHHTLSLSGQMLRALALNGALWQGHVMKVCDACDMELAGRGAASPVPRRRMKLHWLRALRGLCLASKQRILSFLGEAPVLVPHDAASIEEALDMSPAEVIIATGTYHLAQGLRLRSRVRLLGEGATTLQLSAPLEVQSEFGAELSNLKLVAQCPRGCAADALHRCPSCPKAVVRVLGSHLVAVGRGLVGLEGVFGCCSWGKAEVVLERCTIRGGHHALDIRGGCGVRSRAGKQVSTLHRAEEDSVSSFSFDLGSWLGRCRAQGATGAPEVEPASFRPWSGQSWKAVVQTHVRAIDCDISDAGMEAVNLWRGARLHLSGCRLHRCGQGISASLYENNPQFAAFAPFQEPHDLVVENCQFEHFARHDWSSALSLGRFATTGFCRDAALTKSSTTGNLRLRARVVGNSMRGCHAGVLASECALEATGNRFESMKFAAFQIFNGSALLEENEVVHCAVAVSLRAGPRERMPGALTCQLRGNVLHGCELGMKANSAQGSRLQCQGREESFIENGDGLLLQGSSCVVRLSRCQIARCQRGGAHVEKGARLELESCELRENGRGLVVAGGSSADVQRSSFEGHTGWAIRLEPTLSAGEDVEMTTIADNVFGSQLRGNAGRKRIRVDARGDTTVLTGNKQSDGEAVEAVMPKVPRLGDLDAVSAELRELRLL